MLIFSFVYAFSEFFKGDALGAPTETLLPEQRSQQYSGDIRDYVPYTWRRPTDEQLKSTQGHATDDTQLSYWTIEALVGVLFSYLYV